MPVGFVGIDPTIVIGTLELAGGFFVHDKMATGMHLEDRGRTVRGDWPFGHLSDRESLGGGRP